MPHNPIPLSAFATPRHVAIIMDGNGRWAAARKLPRGEGHRRGVEALRKTVRAAGEIGISFLTIFSFSAENWSRPPSEIRDLMGLLRRFIRNDLAELHQNHVKVRVIGERGDLDPDIRRLLEEAEELTKDNDGLTLVVAFNYGARQEIARAAARIAAMIKEGEIDPADVSADLVGQNLGGGGHGGGPQAGLLQRAEQAFNVLIRCFDEEIEVERRPRNAVDDRGDSADDDVPNVVGV